MIELTTNHQDRILYTLRNGGKLLSWEEENSYTSKIIYQLTDKDGNTETIRESTVNKLMKIKFIGYNIDSPALGVSSYEITKLAIHYLSL